MTEREIDALIRLLDDPDKNVYSAVEKKILSVGEPMVGPLEKAWVANEDNMLLQKRIEDIIPIIETDTVQQQLTEWAQNPQSLAKAAWIISRIGDFPLQEAGFMAKYNELKIHLFQYGFNNYSPLEHVKIMNFIFFRKMAFKPCKPHDFTTPSGSYPISVLETKIGTPETLALFYLMYAQDAGLPISGVNLPKNFILSYQAAYQESCFYINPTTSGSVFHKNEIDSFLKNLKLEPKLDYYSPCNNITIVHRILKRLEFSLRFNHQDDMADRIRKMINALPGQLDPSIEWA